MNIFLPSISFLISSAFGLRAQHITFLLLHLSDIPNEPTACRTFHFYQEVHAPWFHFMSLPVEIGLETLHTAPITMAKQGKVGQYNIVRKNIVWPNSFQ